jgi:hypothetical protein
MARMAGRSGRLYMAITSGGVASPVPFMKNWTADFSVDTYEVTCYEDANKTYIAGLPDASGTYSGFFDDATPQMITAATDGVARPFYFYPNRSVNTSYWFGTGIFDTSLEFPVDGPAAASGNWKAAGPVNKVG